MEEYVAELIEFTSEMSRTSSSFERVKDLSGRYRNMGDTDFLESAVKGYNERTILYRSEKELYGEFRDNFMRLFVLTYLEAKRVDPQLAKAFPRALTYDFKGIPGSCILPKFTSLETASLAYKDIEECTPRSIVWHTLGSVFYLYNEFLSGLFSYLAVLCKIANGERYKAKEIFSLPYAKKINKLREAVLRSNNSAIKSSLGKVIGIALPKIRNSISHGTAWLEYSDSQPVSFADSRMKCNT